MSGRGALVLASLAAGKVSAAMLPCRLVGFPQGGYFRGQDCRRLAKARQGEKTMMSTVIGGAMLPHAPQFLTMPETEDKTNVEHVRAVAAGIGQKLRALNPDLWIIFSNDHAEQFFHNAAPPFTVHVGGEASGDFAGRKFHWKIPSEIGFEI